MKKHIKQGLKAILFGLVGIAIAAMIGTPEEPAEISIFILPILWGTSEIFNLQERIVKLWEKLNLQTKEKGNFYMNF